MKIKITNKYTGEIDYSIGLCSDGYLVELCGNGEFWRVVNKDDYKIEFIED